jgi:hypothetical protein
MAEWTGVLYAFYTNKDTQTVIDNAIGFFGVNFGYQVQRGSHDGEKWFLFFESEKMLEYHLENGYNVDLGGKGCFCIEQKLVKLDGVASLFEFEGNTDFIPFDVNMYFDDICYLCLVLPEPKEESTFCLDIHTGLRNVIKSTSSLRQQS